MVPLMSLWIPILLSSVVVFVASSIIHMVLGYHKNDFRKVPKEDGVMDALRPFNIPPGDYMLPRAANSKDMKSAEYLEKLNKGPVAVFTIMPNGPFGMGKSLVLWFLYSVVVGLFAAYIAGRALPPGSPYLAVHRFAGATAFAGYSLALLQNSIWYARSWKTTLTSMFDGLIYGFLTGGVFGALWPK
jgi:hypothetical protein